jgi:hypothetical protein
MITLVFRCRRPRFLPFCEQATYVQDTGMNDYINANYIKGANGKPIYLATQAPVPESFPRYTFHNRRALIYSFWQMIWDTKATAVVMVTNEVAKHVRAHNRSRAASSSAIATGPTSTSPQSSAGPMPSTSASKRCSPSMSSGRSPSPRARM